MLAVIYPRESRNANTDKAKDIAFEMIMQIYTDITMMPNPERNVALRAMKDHALALANGEPPAVNAEISRKKPDESEKDAARRCIPLLKAAVSKRVKPHLGGPLNMEHVDGAVFDAIDCLENAMFDQPFDIVEVSLRATAKYIDCALMVEDREIVVARPFNPELESPA